MCVPKHEPCLARTRLQLLLLVQNIARIFLFCMFLRNYSVSYILRIYFVVIFIKTREQKWCLLV